MRYVAFLRGINVGGRKVLMEDLQKVFTDMGFANVRTLIASGNVLFDASEQEEEKLVESLEKSLQQQFGFQISVILRTRDEIQELLLRNPFGSKEYESGTRLQITFLASKVKETEKIEQEGFTITKIGKRELASVVSPTGKTTNLMTFLDKTFGKNSTTRNWNTIQKILS